MCAGELHNVGGSEISVARTAVAVSGTEFDRRAATRLRNSTWAQRLPALSAVANRARIGEQAAVFQAYEGPIEPPGQQPVTTAFTQAVRTEARPGAPRPQGRRPVIVIGGVPAVVIHGH
jgi:hypothetical protein